MAQKPSHQKQVQVAYEIGKLTKRLGNRKGGLLSGLHVTTRPINGLGQGIELIFSGNFTAKQRKDVGEFLQNGFKEEVQPVLKSKLGWNNIRIKTCSRDKSPSRFCWLIESRQVKITNFRS